jgi:hypothetical protein
MGKRFNLFSWKPDTEIGEISSFGSGTKYEREIMPSNGKRTGW